MDRWQAGQRPRAQARRRRAGQDRQIPVVALVSRDTGEVRSTVDAQRPHLHTDSAKSYVKIAGDFAGHSTVDDAGEYVLDGVTTNHAET